MKLGIVNKSSWGGSDSFKEIELRETKSFYIDDKTGVKYRKSRNDGTWYLATKRNDSSHRYSRSVDYIVDLNGEYVQRIKSRKAEDEFLRQVKGEIESLLESCKTFEDAKKLNDQLSLGLSHEKINS